MPGEPEYPRATVTIGAPIPNEERGVQMAVTVTLTGAELRALARSIYRPESGHARAHHDAAVRKLARAVGITAPAARAHDAEVDE